MSKKRSDCMELVKVYEHKRVKINDEIKDLLKIVYVTYADIEGSYAMLENPMGKCVKKISESEIEESDFLYTEVDTKLITSEELNDDKILEEAKKKLLGKYYEVLLNSDTFPCLEEVVDDHIKDTYEHNVVPSLSASLTEKFENMKNNSIFLDANITAQLLGKTNSLELQDENKYKGIKDYDIKGLYSKLKEIVFGQDNQLKMLLANIIKNISLSYSNLDSNVVKILKNNILLIGPLGTGKTLMIESIANILDIPYIICDAKRYTSNGYVGEDIESILLNLCNKYDKEKAEHGIVFIDEIDKICEKKDERSHVTTTDIQETLLKLLDGTLINKTIRNGFSEEQFSFDTSRMTFVFAGAFTSIFESKQDITLDVLESYGMRSELARRIRTKIVLNKPTKENLKNSLINGKYSYLKLFNDYLEMLNIDYEINDDFIDYIVDKAFLMDFGYSGLGIAISDYIDEYLYDLIGGDVRKLVYKAKK